jgi:non-heme chloroperoxidase
MPFVQARDQTRLFYTEGGTGNPIVFAASAWLDSRMWEFQIPYLVDHGFRCIAYDRRGHGRSDFSWDGYDYSAESRLPGWCRGARCMCTRTRRTLSS